MLVKRFLIAGAVAITAFAASANLSPAHAEMPYVGQMGCAVLGSPSNDFFCSEYEIDDSYAGGNDGGGGGGYDPAARICGKFDRSLCGDSYTKVVETYNCNEWKVTQLNGSVEFFTQKPVGGGVGGAITCSNYVKTTLTTVVMYRWNK